jgi:hypothetical protein
MVALTQAPQPRTMFSCILTQGSRPFKQIIPVSPSCMQSRCVIPSANAFILSSDYSCLPGLYCPFLKIGDNSTFPAMCPPTIDCSIKRLTGGWCSPQGKNEPRICPKGFFCPAPTVSHMCPDGYWCPRGSSQPIACEWLSSCPEGSAFRTHWGLLLLCAIVDLLVLSLSFWNFKVLHKLKKSLWSHTSSSVEITSADFSCPLPSDKASTAASPHAAGFGNNNSVGHLLSTGFANMNRTGNIKLRVVDLTVELPHRPSYASCFRRKLSPLNVNPDPLKSDSADATPRLSPSVNIISRVSAVFAPGRLHAIMGPSGCGKTTLLHCIAGKLDASSGSIFLNSATPVNPRLVKKCVGFVPQDDVMLRTLTVEEIVRHRFGHT